MQSRKEKSGIRIIELSIQSEEDILDIVNSTNLNECEKVKLHNFKRKEVLAEDFAQPFQNISYIILWKAMLNEIRLLVGITITTERESMK